jgi:hypothetical protein
MRMKPKPRRKRFDAAAALDTLALVRASIPEKFRVPVPPREAPPQQLHFPADFLDEDAMELFEMEAVQEGVESVLAELTASLENARDLALKEALKVFYTAEELAKDPENAELIPHVISMREAYERDFGKPIPPRPADFKLLPKEPKPEAKPEPEAEAKSKEE